MNKTGFDMRQEENGTWTVFDNYSGKPVVHNDVEQTGLTEDEANEMLETLRQDFIEKSPEKTNP